MILRTFLDKTNTIIRGSEYNYGLNPISVLYYGGDNSRILVHFDVSRVKDASEKLTIGSLSEAKHILKMCNCESINKLPYKNTCRATSFTVYAIKVPVSWDAGDGFDDKYDFWLTGESALSKDGSTWKKPTNESKWESEGVFTIDFIKNEVAKYESGEESIVVGKQHFDRGNENLEIDITRYVNDVLSGIAENNGLLLVYAPILEESKSNKVNYAGFFNNNTNTAFKPYIETFTDEKVLDDRYCFALKKSNRLYLVFTDGGEYANLDNLPSCTIEGVDYEVHHQCLGMYYVTVTLADYEPDMVLNDVWSDLVYNGVDLGTVEQEFVTHPSGSVFRFGESLKNNSLYPEIGGINDYEKVPMGDMRTVSVNFKKSYTHNDHKLISKGQYRVYIKNGEDNVAIDDWQPLMRVGMNSFFIVDSQNYSPNLYHVDIRYENGTITKTFIDVVKFEIIP